ncbi:hypothetical protein WN944_003372 [Citrus x changshan-huyou]|uniref:Uncharacterized protein n=1 Tax=Citrus x changshan-huyou TaxID=2935761 RepID=A0AAP0M319_9ROSI
MSLENLGKLKKKSCEEAAKKYSRDGGRRQVVIAIGVPTQKSSVVACSTATVRTTLPSTQPRAHSH